MALDIFMPGTTGTFPNRILLIKDRDHDEQIQMRLDITIFPLFCDCCNTPLNHFYIHKGSKKGFVGNVLCPNCKTTIEVRDGNDMVDFIEINGTSIHFDKLYLLEWSYIEQLDAKFNNAASSALFYDYHKTGLNYLSVDELIRRLTIACSIQITGEMEFGTDPRFFRLPAEINHWIEFLYRAGIQLPSYVTVIKEGSTLDSIKGTAIYRLHHMDELIASYPGHKKSVFETNTTIFKHPNEKESVNNSKTTVSGKKSKKNEKK